MEKKMSNDKIVQLISKGEQILGLTETGHLAVFDDNLNAFKIRGKSEVYNQQHEVVTINPVVSARKMAIEIQNKPEVVDESKSSTMIIVALIVGLLILVATVAFLVTRLNQHLWV